MMDQPRRVLVAENEALIRTAVATSLSDAGFAVLEAARADDALAVLTAQAASIRVLFTDIQMPGRINGLQLAHEAAVRWPWIALLVASGKDRPQSGDLPPGCRFLTKPYAPDTVVIHVMELMDAS
jgi:CheY-like chemotaxis protein